jgi:hypothetical protein
MSEEQDPITEIVDELTLLKERANIMGIKFHPNIGVDKLKAKVTARQAGEADPTEELDTIQASQDASQAAQNVRSDEDIALAAKIKRKEDAMRLVRIRVSNMNPVKGTMMGEIIQVGNSELGVIKKYIPFNAEQGWHMPSILVDEIRNKKYMSHYEVKEGNKKINKHKLVPEYSIEVLEPLTADELKDLTNRQLMANKG